MAAKARIMLSFASSEGWNRMPAMEIQRLAPLTVTPMTGTKARRIKEPRRISMAVRYQIK